MVGTLCGDCQKGYGVTFDLRFCRRCGAGGIVLFVFICKCASMQIDCCMYNHLDKDTKQWNFT